MIKRFSILTAAFLLILSLTSCSLLDTEDRFVGGKMLDDEMMSEIREEIFGSGDKGVGNPENPGGAPSMGGENLENEDKGDVDNGKTVYWTKSGTVWHIYSDCGSLKNAIEVFSGSVDEAREKGKEKLCSKCEGREDS